VAAAVVVVTLGAGIVLAGTPARGQVFANSAEILARLPNQVDPSTLPAVTIGDGVTDYVPDAGSGGLTTVLVTLAQNLEFENQALLRRDDAILTAVDHGDRLIEMRQRLSAAEAGGEIRLAHYRFDAVHATVLIPFGKQDGFSIGLQATGTKTEETYAGLSLQSRAESPFEQTFAVRRATGDRWLLVAVLSAPPG
jgi:hypothetical protein